MGVMEMPFPRPSGYCYVSNQ